MAKWHQSKQDELEPIFSGTSFSVAQVDGFYNEMDQEFDDVRLKKNSYDKRLSILKDKIANYQIFKKRKMAKKLGHINVSSTDKIFLSNNELSDGEFTKESSSSTIVAGRQDYVRLFIEKLKLNSFNSLHNKKINLDKVKGLTEKINTIAMSQHVKGLKGFKASNRLKLFITFITFLTIVSVQFLSTFQCLFDDYRAQQNNQQWFIAFKYTLLVSNLIRIFSKLTFTTTILGERLEYISSITYHYLTNFQFYLDVLVFFSVGILIWFHEQGPIAAFGCCSMVLNIFYFERMNEVIDVIIINNNIKKQLFALLRLLLANFFISHLVATLLIGMTYVGDGLTWMDKYGIVEQVWSVKYFYAVYWGATVISTVGFGDISINNKTEAIFVTCVMLLGGIILSYNIFKVATIIESLNQVPNQVRNQLSVLRRLAVASQINEDLHHTIGEYIIHAAEIKKTFEVAERNQLIKMLPSQMKEEFIEQSSKNFCAKLPFFFMLECETKKRVCESLTMEVVAPNEYLTHKRQGLKKIVILRKGIIGLAYRKKGSQLNGKIVHSIEIGSETEKPELLNTYLLTRGKKLMYDIICQKYCIVAMLEYDQFIAALKESEKDYELYHQTYDKAIIRTNEWNREKCEYCSVRHSLFVCPKIHYVPLRNIVFMRHQKNVGKKQQKYKFLYGRQKNWYSQCPSLKFRRSLFVPFEKVFGTNIQKSYVLRVNKVTNKLDKEPQSMKWGEYDYVLFPKLMSENISLNVDIIQNFKNYFHRSNANNLILTNMVRNSSSVHLQKISADLY